MKKKLFVGVALAGFAGWAFAQLLTPDPVTIGEGTLTLVHDLYVGTGELSLSFTEKITTDPTTDRIHKVRSRNYPVVPGNPVAVAHTVYDLRNRTATIWADAAAEKSTSKRGKLSLEEQKQYWAQTECGTKVAATAASEATSDKTVVYHGEHFLQPGNVRTFMVETRNDDSACCGQTAEESPVDHYIKRIYRAPAFGCEEVALETTAVLKDGSRMTYESKRLVAFSPKSLAIPSHDQLREGARGDMLRRAEERMGVPDISARKLQRYDEINKRYYENRPDRE